MKRIIYFIFGILFYGIVLPIIESLAALFGTWIEVKKGKMSIEIAKYNTKIQTMGENFSPKPTIGFKTIEIEEDEEEEEYDE